ncbi:hypothetical protein HPB52_018829 [Rhipicephalus sanguineus]|uniref:HTH CENPB-type domain-containing protein n=1 Tax=Rhipicephalus sanguineus TaxID=34632 RepID=A0A9D4Q1Z9_RHISA|nr:hypothetical protein HPB52_018829 [Rhipicephalus sanguineus]
MLQFEARKTAQEKEVPAATFKASRGWVMRFMRHHQLSLRWRKTLCQQVRWVTGNKILRILKGKGLAPDLPEDLYSLIKKAVAIRKHLERNRKDRDSKFRLILVESRIHRLVRYYKAKRILAPTWRYESSTASALVA